MVRGWVSFRFLVSPEHVELESDYLAFVSESHRLQFGRGRNGGREGVKLGGTHE